MIAGVGRVPRWPTAALTAAALVTACSSQSDQRRSLETRQWTEDMAFTISMDPPPPPHAADRIRFKVVVRDKKTGQPIENGEGRIYANTREGARTNDGLGRGPELGTYYANLFFAVAGPWAIGMQFRRDPTRALETMNWMQDVLPPADTLR